MRRKTDRSGFLLFSLLLLWCCGPLAAQERIVSLQAAHALAAREPGAKAAPDTGPFSGMTHTEWTRSDGAPGSISSLAQTSEGYLWIGSSLGLYRFDGVHFAVYPFSPEQVPLPTQDVASVAADPQGGLWVGLRMTAVVHLRSDGSAVVYGRSSGLTSDTLDRVAVRKDGSVWALAGGRLLTLRGDRWVNFGQDRGLGQQAVFSLFLDRDETMWVAQDHRLMALGKNASNFKRMPASVFFVSAMAQTRKGEIWMADAWRTVRTVSQPPGKGTVRLQGKAELLADSYNNLWIAEDYFGLTRVRDIDSKSYKKEGIEHASSSQWLTSPQIGGILEDRDGNIWVGTALGLDRYQRTIFEKFRGATLNYYPAVIGARDGSVWINSHGEPLMRWYRGKLTTYGSFVTYGPFAARRNGEVCFIDARASELQCYGSERATHVLLDKRIEYAPALTMIEDADGSMLVSFENKGIWRYHGVWDRVYSQDLPVVSPLSMFLDSSARLWMGFQGNQIVVRSGGRFQALSMTPGPWANTLAFYEGAGTVWMAGSSGLGFFDGRQLQRARGNVDGIFEGTSGIAFDRAGNLWLNSGAGALRVRSASVAHLLHSSDHRTDAEVFNDRDGLTGKPTQLKPTPSLIADAHGRLWFATAGNLVSVDPQQLSEDTHEFDVLVESFLLDGRLLLSNGLKSQVFQAAPSGRHSLEVTFAALNLSEPERMTYRYRLTGEDTAWQEAGSRRQAFYTRLHPGEYTFEVSARRGEGPWVEMRAPLRIAVLHSFYQTGWFYALALLSFSLLLFAVYVVRLRQVTGRIRMLSEERSRERMKIARDLHDTLLQGIHGLMLRFHFAAQTVRGDAEREGLESALEFADKILAEGRERVRHLRTSRLPAPNLAGSIALIGSGLNRESQAEFHVHEEGVPRALHPTIQDEVYCIAREALTNSFEHAHASTISVTIQYGKSHFRLVCFDNGRGMDAETLKEGLAGHWGLQGMRERARHIGARFESRSGSGDGTEIAVVVPSARAYEGYRWWRRLRVRA